MKTIYDNLLDVKKIRQDKILSEMTQAKKVLEQAMSLVRTSVKSLQDYKILRKEKEEAIYKKIFEAGMLSKDKLDEERSKLALFKEKEISLMEDLNKAKEDHKKSEEKFEEVRISYMKATKNMEKFQDLKKEENAKSKLIEDRKTDSEVEEMFTKSKNEDIE